MNTCRICWEDAPTTSLLEPCLCRGSVRYVHPQCLFRELEMRNRVDFLDITCRVCGSLYEITKPRNDIARQAIFAIFMLFTYTIAFVHNTFMITALMCMLFINVLICTTPLVLRLPEHPFVIHVLAAGAVMLVLHEVSSVLSIVTSGLLPLLVNLYWISREITLLRFLAGTIFMFEFNILIYAMYIHSKSSPAAILLFSLMSVLPLSMTWSMV